jgi:hypothetical protein
MDMYIDSISYIIFMLSPIQVMLACFYIFRSVVSYV